MYHSLSIINAGAAEQARENALKGILHKRRTADAARRAAALLAGKYITKRLEPELAAAFPDARRVYLYQPSYGAQLFLEVCYDGGDARDDNISIYLAQRDTRRINPEGLNERAANEEKEIARLENGLKQLDEYIAWYNSIARDYAAAHAVLKYFIEDMPYPDYDLGRMIENAKTAPVAAE